MRTIIPAMNTTWFWFEDEADRRRHHGTPRDVMRKYRLLESRDLVAGGLEIFLFPAELDSPDQFEPWFYRKFSRLPYKTVHIGDTDPWFLTDSEDIALRLNTLRRILERMEAGAVVIHAHHFKRKRLQIRELLSETLPGTAIYVENNGFDDEEGAGTGLLLEIFRDCPDFFLCLDIAHVKDFGWSLADYFGTPELGSRIREVHFSYSTRCHQKDLYELRGYPGYAPFHALFSVVGEKPGLKTKELLRTLPVVLEGIVPREDKDMNFLKQEMELLD